MDSAPIPATSPADTGKLRLLTLADLDSRTRAARQARELMDSIETDLGGSERLSAAERQIVQRAAVTGALLESMEAHWLSGDGIDLQAYLPAANAQRRLLESLGLQRRTKDVTPSLSEYLSRRTTDHTEAA